MRGLQGMSRGLKGMRGFHACVSRACGRLTAFPVEGKCPRCAGTTVEDLIALVAPKADTAWLYACAACPANMVRPYWTQRPGVYLCGICASHGPDDPPQRRAVIYHGPVLRTSPNDKVVT